MTDRDRDMSIPQEPPDKVTTMIPVANRSFTSPVLPRPLDQKPEKFPDHLKKASYRPKPNTSVCLNKDYPMVEGLCFKNMAEAQQSMAIAQWYAPQDDGTIPETDEEYRAIVMMLVDAFKDMRTAQDTMTNAYRKRFTPGEDAYYKDWAIEACAWDIVAKAKSIHTEGFKIAIYDKSIVDYISQTQKWLFQDRINWICQVLRTSKHVAVTLMKHEKNWVTIGAPHKLYSSTMVNAVSNAHRGKWIKEGRGADKEHQERPVKGKRTKAQLAASNGDGVDMDHAIDVSPAAAVGGNQTDVQHQELARKRQKLEHIASDGEEVDEDNATDVDYNVGVHSLKEPEKSLKPSRLVINSPPDKPDPDANIRELMHGKLPDRSLTAVSGQDASFDYHRNPDIQGESHSDNRAMIHRAKHDLTSVSIASFGTPVNSNSRHGSELSEAPASLVSDTSSAASPKNMEDDFKGTLPALELQIHDAAYLESARVLASLRTGGTHE